MKARDPARFEEQYQPVVCTLTVVREPVPVEQLVELSKKFAPSKEALPTARYAK